VQCSSWQSVAGSQFPRSGEKPHLVAPGNWLSASRPRGSLETRPCEPGDRRL